MDQYHHDIRRREMGRNPDADLLTEDSEPVIEECLYNKMLSFAQEIATRRIPIERAATMLVHMVGEAHDAGVNEALNFVERRCG